MVNHFSMNIQRKSIYQYQVEFQPEIERRGAMYRMLALNADTLGENMIFDGRMLFLGKQTEDSLKLQATHNGITYDISIMATKIYDPESSDLPIQFYDLVLKKVCPPRFMGGLALTDTCSVF